MNPERSARKVPLRPVLIAATAILVVCGGALAVVGYAIPWRYWYDKPETAVLTCEVRENTAMVTVKVTNWSWSDRTYAVTVTVRNRKGGTAGSQSNEVEVPSRHSRTQTWVVITTPDGEDCEISRAELA